ncbi:MAG: hypothetical protein JRD68_06470 [Deltaproteobacteria bacterium]|nr:hypothetical protein [Deltaproteobacteria bacterium]
MSIEDLSTADNGVKIVRATSAFDCGGRCPLRIHVKDNVILRIEGDDTEDKDEQLRTCLRCRALFSLYRSCLRPGLPGKGDCETGRRRHCRG